jgi:hypothetical protein
MTRSAATKAIQEAKRFISAAQSAVNLHDGLQLKASFKSDNMDRCKENASAIRASMDLTRVLADLRR